MRRPSTRAELYAGWKAMLDAQAVSLRRTGMSRANDWEPGCGWYRTRFVKDGPPVPARVWCEREIDPETGELTCDERLVFEVGGERRAWFPINLVFHAITRETFEQMTEARRGDLRLQATHAAYDFVAAGPPRP